MGGGDRERRWWCIAALLAPAAVLDACGEVWIGYGDGHHHDCDDDRPAIVVRFVDHRDARPVAVAASGTLRDGGYVSNLAALDASTERGGRTTRLGGGFGRAGVYDVSVATAAGERFEWQGVTVRGRGCGLDTVELEAAVAPS